MLKIFQIATILLLLTLSSNTIFASEPNKNSSGVNSNISESLDAFHTAASNADWDTYFGLMTPDSIFIGTDVSERWDIATFKKYATASNGWTYAVKERHIDVANDGNTAWFDEILHNKNYGTSRGTGVLIRSKSGWKVAQYHLTFPIPNEIAGGITSIIQGFENK